MAFLFKTVWEGDSKNIRNCELERTTTITPIVLNFENFYYYIYPAYLRVFKYNSLT